jgi:hypothetical protein
MPQYLYHQMVASNQAGLRIVSGEIWFGNLAKFFALSFEEASNQSKASPR